MKTFWKNLALIASLVAAATAIDAGAAVIATWDFDSPAFNGTVPYSANSTDGAAVSSASLNDANGGSVTVTGGAGNPGTSLEFTTANASQNLNTSIVGPNPTFGNSYFTLTLTANASLTTFSISYDDKGSGTSPPTSDQWYYRVNGSTAWTLASGANTTIGASYGNHTVSFTGLSVVSGNTIDFRDTFSGAGAGMSGTLDFDNIQVSAVPEPINVALAGFGIGAIVIALGRQLLALRKRRQSFPQTAF